MAFDGRDETSLNRGNDRQRHAAKFAILNSVQCRPSELREEVRKVTNPAQRTLRLGAGAPPGLPFGRPLGRRREGYRHGR